MNEQEEIEKLKAEISKLQQRLRQLEKTSDRFWEPQEGEAYYHASGGRIETFNNDSNYDKEEISVGEAFKTLKECEQHVERKKLLYAIKKWRAENDPESFFLNWNDEDQEKYCIVYNHVDEEFTTEIGLGWQALNQQYFSSWEKAHACIEHFGERLNLLKEG